MFDIGSVSMDWSLSKDLSDKAMLLLNRLIDAESVGRPTRQNSTVASESGVGLVTMLTTPSKGKINGCGRLKSLAVNAKYVVLISILARWICIIGTLHRRLPTSVRSEVGLGSVFSLNYRNAFCSVRTVMQHFMPDSYGFES